MRTRQTIALLLAAVYLLMTVGAPVATLSCECLSSHDHAELFCPCHAGEASESGACLAEPCCPDLHSTEIALYLSLIESIGKYLRCAVTDLPPALAADRTLSAPLSEGTLLRVARCVALVPDPVSLAPGFRAPPVRG
ncbi:MAG TPA: hypothetical protein IAA35_05965 [Candidatus Alistipes faecigallinarum]|nr:hypothetical protein [Candidatus Alistipes faecigallinarum]